WALFATAHTPTPTPTTANATPPRRAPRDPTHTHSGGQRRHLADQRGQLANAWWLQERVVVTVDVRGRHGSGEEARPGWLGQEVGRPLGADQNGARPDRGARPVAGEHPAMRPENLEPAGDCRIGGAAVGGSRG